MRNLKKILALALALVMSMSLMATANAFADDEQITETYETAVDVLSGLKVFQGYDDGNFKPQGPITRAEVAAIIYRIVTGDVDDTQVDIYADYNKFDDVKSTSWYAGYVNFCANAEYIKGYDAKTFGPNDPVTGYHALAMILRALGYDKNGEFTGTNWTIQTAAVGESQGILQNIKAGTLGANATREVVAEILFQAIMVPKATYTPAFGYQTVVNGVENTSLGWDTFELEYVTGVVTANEYADLYDTEGLAEGKTRLDVDGEDYTIAYATDLTNMGMAYNVYLYDGDKVLTIADAGNTVFETGEGTEINKSNTGMTVSDAAKFLNFGEDATVYTSDWKIEYEVSFEVKRNAAGQTGDPELKAALEDLKDAGFNVTEFPEKSSEYDWKKLDDNTELYTISFSFRPNANISSAHMNNIEEIFAIADKEDADDADEYVTGEVYVGTRSTDDVSDEMSFKQFKAEYIDSENKDADYTESDNGEWLKVIDNDGDGVADYIFLTEFAMSVIDRISRDDEYTFAALADDKNDKVAFNETEKVDGGDIETEDELAEGDVIIWTEIDGVYYVDLAEMVTETIDARGINSKTETITCDGEDYIQSHIGYVEMNAGDVPYYYSDVTDAHTEWTYDLYLDHFGYVRLFIESDWDTFMLLTDGWYENDRRVETFQAMYWDVDAAEETLIDVVDNSHADEFISTDLTGDQETWGMLKGAEVTYNLNGANRFITNIAGYAAADDGYELMPLDSARAYRVGYDVQGLDLSDFDLGDRQMTADDDSRIQATTNTQYYLVIKGYDSRTHTEYVDTVITWTGYANTPDEAALENADAYAVTHEGYSSVAGTYDYTIADVVVFESDSYTNRNTYFVYETNNWTTEYVWGVGYGEDGEIVDDLVYVDVNGQPTEIKFYEIYEDGMMVRISSNYADNNIYAGLVDVLYNVGRQDYIQVRGTAAGTLEFNASEIPVYCVGVDGRDYTVSATNDWDDIDVGDHLILFTDNDENVEYAIWVEGSVDDDDHQIVDVATLWTEINTWAAATYLDRAEVIIDENGALNGTHTIAEAEALLTEATTYWNRTDVTTDAKNKLETSEAIAYLKDAIAGYYKAQLNDYVADPELTDDQKTEVDYAAELATQSATVTDKASFDDACAALDAFCKAYKDALAEVQAEAVALLNAYAKQLETNNKLTTVQAAALASALADQIKAVNDDEATKADVEDIVAADEAGEVSGTGVTALDTAIAGAVSTDDQNAVDTTVAAINAALKNDVDGTLTVAVSDAAPSADDIKNAVEEAVEDLAMNGATIEVGNVENAPVYSTTNYEVDVVVTITVTKNNAKETVDVTAEVTSTDWQDVAEYDVPSDLSAEFDDAAGLTKDAVIAKINAEDGLSEASITSGWPEYPATFEEDVAVTINFSATYTKGVASKTVTGSIEVTLNVNP